MFTPSDMRPASYALRQLCLKFFYAIADYSKMPHDRQIELLGILEAVQVTTVSLILVSNVIARSVLLANLMVLG